MGIALLWVEVEFAHEFMFIEFKRHRKRLSMLLNRNMVSITLPVKKSEMQKQSLFFAASIALMIATSSVAHAQSNFVGYEVVANETYGKVIWGEQVMIQPVSMVTTASPEPNPIYEVERPVSTNVVVRETPGPTPFDLPLTTLVLATPVPIAAPAVILTPSVQQPVMQPAIRQPVCLAGS